MENTKDFTKEELKLIYDIVVEKEYDLNINKDNTHNSMKQVYMDCLGKVIPLKQKLESMLGN